MVLSLTTTSQGQRHLLVHRDILQQAATDGGKWWSHVWEACIAMLWHVGKVWIFICWVFMEKPISPFLAGTVWFIYLCTYGRKILIHNEKRRGGCRRRWCFFIFSLDGWLVLYYSVVLMSLFVICFHRCTFRISFLLSVLMYCCYSSR
jgi:hypothetical protein